jgi:predicted small metal-binding protein
LNEKEDNIMGKVIYCNKVVPSGDCNHVIRGKTEEEILQQAKEHAKEHGLEPTPELLEMVKAFIEEE